MEQSSQYKEDLNGDWKNQKFDEVKRTYNESNTSNCKQNTFDLDTQEDTRRQFNKDSRVD